jgi:hypothetical protein
MRAIIVAGLVILMFAAVHAETDDGAELARVRSEYADVLALGGEARAELLAFARVLRARPSMAIDFTHLDTPQHCLNTGGDMLHVANAPKAKVPLAYFHPAEALVKAGLDVTKLPIEPEKSAELEPNAWYYYPSNGRVEPFHGRALDTPMVIRTVGLK